jgi:glycerophosphoryl diester phosphodiesterase
VRKKKLAEIQSLDAGSWFADAYRYERVPTLEAALQFIQKKALMNIEIKKEGVSQRVSGGIEEKIIDRVTQHGLASHVLISSFSALAVSRCKRLAPEIPNALLLSRVPRAFPRKTIEKVEPHGIHVPKEGLSRRWVEMCKKNDLPLRVYTVNSKGQMEKLKRWGVSGIFTDRIDLLMGC